MRVLVASDAWRSQVNGVVRTLEALARHAPALGADVSHPRRLPDPAVSPGGAPRPRRTPRRRPFRRGGPQAAHVATEGPVGLAVRRLCLARARGVPFTTSYHTRFPEYLAPRLSLPGSPTERAGHARLRRFHGAARGTMVATASLGRDWRNEATVG